MKSRKEILKRQEKLVALHKEAKKKLTKIPGVIHVGVGIKEINGELTEELSFRVYVKEKKAQKELLPEHTIPKKFLGVKTDVLAKSESVELVDDAKYRPLKGGVQVRNEKYSSKNTRGGEIEGGVGTLGCLATLADGSEAIVGLSNEHVLCSATVPGTNPRTSSSSSSSSGATCIGTRIGQPRFILSICCFTYNEIGIILNSQKDSTVDCAIIKLDEDIIEEINENGTINHIEGIGEITGVAQAVCFETLRKRGRTTDITSGNVVDVLYEGSQILIEPVGAPEFADFGDSGAVVVNSENKVVGLLWATDRSTKNKGVANHIGPVLNAMNITIAGDIPTGLSMPTVPCLWDP